MEYPKLYFAVDTLHRQSLERQRHKATLIESAKTMAAAGRFSDAIDLYEDVASNGADPGDLHALALLYFRNRRFWDTCATLIRCLKKNPVKAEYHFDFGRALKRCEYPRDMVNEYLETMAVDAPGMVEEKRWRGSEKTAQAGLERIAAYGRILADAPPSHPGGYVVLGHFRLVQSRMAEAVRAYESALEIEPRDVAALESLAFVLRRRRSPRAGLAFAEAYYRQRRYADAAPHYRRSLRKQLGGVKAYRRLADCYYQLHEFRKAVDVCEEGIGLFDRAPRLYALWIRALLQSGRTEEAIGCATFASTACPEDMELAFLRDLSLPVVYRTREEVSASRSRVEGALARLDATLDLDTPGAARRALQGLPTNFYLAYQGANDRSFNEKYGRLVTRIMRKNYPQWSRRLRMPPLTRRERIRVGYFSPFLRSHTVGKLFLGWLSRHDRKRFDVRVYHPHATKDLLASEVEGVVDRFYLLTEMEAICQQARADKLHVFVILDIGMNPLSTKLGGLRVAPVQCLAWGHPVTSGLPNMDYFLSSDLMEPDNGEEHYTETLVRLPGSGICVPRPFLGNTRKTRSEFGLPEEAVVYLSPQSVFKYLPQYDFLFPAIAKRVPQSKFVFLESDSRALTDILRKRLLVVFREYSLKGDRYLVFLPRQEYLNFLQLNRISDVFLDTPGWSGGMTTLEALGCALPVVTWPGKFMRGRHSYAFLKQMGVTGTVASSLDHYVEIAAGLGNNEVWRHEVSSKIRERSDRLYDDDSCVRALERFYRRVVKEGVSSSLHSKSRPHRQLQ